ncbi:unnamed protein product [Miscanthus lutarioriparius]|uniref:Uncharacterized protein n=1 Tax=Miscanthus lutarioriparius TaxID=422564 RepID=A0A811RF45_9POAL|nr:unnamed protein product [Miscanthus lutarioriparius]
MPFPVRLPPPSTTAAAAAATVGAVLAAVALRRYLSASRHGPSARVSMSVTAGAATTLVANFAKLLVGVVCVADVQFKGRGEIDALLYF